MEEINDILQFSLIHNMGWYNLNSIDNLVLERYKSNGYLTEETFTSEFGPISYILKDKTFQIFYQIGNYFLEKEPFLFYNEEKKLLGKTHSYEVCLNTLNMSMNNYDIILEGKILHDLNNILKYKSRNFIFKKKIMFKYYFFEDLNKKKELDTKNCNIKIKINELSPIPSIEFNIKDKTIDFILENRDQLIKEIIDFMEKPYEKILKVYGCDGIGKSATYIYLSNIFNSFKVLYFNLKKINLSKNNKEILKDNEIYKFELMRYFTLNKNCVSSNFFKNSSYKQYLEELKNIKEDPFNFWEELYNFAKNKRYYEKTLIILDQYEDKYTDDLNYNNLIKLILTSVSTFKLLISYSVNNYNSKYKLAEQLEYCSNDSPIIINDINEAKKPKENIFEQKFEGIELDNPINYDKEHDDISFEKIYILNFIGDYNIENKKSDVNKNEDIKNDKISNDNIKGDINEKIQINNNGIKTDEMKISENDKKVTSNEKMYFSQNLMNINETNLNNNNEQFTDNNNSSIEDFNINTNSKNRTIYINELISVQKIEDKKCINYLKIFNYNPKYYIKFKNYIYDNKNEDIEVLFNKFLEETYTHICKKIDKYYSNINKNIILNEPLVELMNLKYLVDNKVKFTTPVLIDYIKRYPIKYIKIKKDNDNNQAIIDLNNQFDSTEFYFEYCFPFFGLILSKIIYMNENYNVISYLNLSGSARGSFFEEKLKRSIVYEECFYEEKMTLRYVWDFTSNKIDKDKNINYYDYINFKEIKYDENQKCIKLKPERYYIVPGCQTNKNLDSAILIPDSNNNFILITFQIKQGEDFEIKEKLIYIKFSFLTKQKFEKLYNINISNVYFYFVLPSDFKTNKEKEDKKQIKELSKKKIAYIFYSFKDKKITTQVSERKLALYELLDENAKIFNESNYTNEEENLENKIILIKNFELFLKKKRYAGIVITRNIYENGRKVIFNKDKGIRLTNKERQDIINELTTKYKIKNKFTIKYIFKIKNNEIFDINAHKNLFGLFTYNNSKYIYYDYRYFELYPKKGNNNNVNDYLMNINRNIQKTTRYNYPDKTISLDEIKDEKDIYVFKIYYFNIA